MRRDEPLSGRRIVLDPGHGIFWHMGFERWSYQRRHFIVRRGRAQVSGTDFELDAPGYVEDDGIMPIAAAVARRLSDLGAEVLPTRALDPITGRLDRRASRYVPGRQRWQEGALLFLGPSMHGRLRRRWEPLVTTHVGSTSAWAFDLHIRHAYERYGAGEVDAFVSLHTNAAGYAHTDTRRGTETYADGTPAGMRLGSCVHEELLASIRRSVPDWKDARPGASPIAAGWAVTRHTRAPAVLVELGHHDSAADLPHLTDRRWIRRVGEGVAAGLVRFLA